MQRGGGVACELPSSLYLAKTCPFIITGCASVHTHPRAWTPVRARCGCHTRLIGEDEDGDVPRATGRAPMAELLERSPLFLVLVPPKRTCALALRLWRNARTAALLLPQQQSVPKCLHTSKSRMCVSMGARVSQCIRPVKRRITQL